jgi:hypothetical protein
MDIVPMEAPNREGTVCPGPFPIDCAGDRDDDSQMHVVIPPAAVVAVTMVMANVRLLSTNSDVAEQRRSNRVITITTTDSVQTVPSIKVELC